MRFLHGIRSYKSLEKELSIVFEVLYSNVFIYLDLIILSLFLAYLFFPLHGSFMISIGIFIAFICLFSSLFIFLERRFKD